MFLYKKKGYIMIQAVLALILLSAAAISFFQVYSGQFASLASVRSGKQAQQAAELVSEYLKMQDYAAVTAGGNKTGTVGSLFGTGLNNNPTLSNLKYQWTLGPEKTFKNGSTTAKLRVATISIFKDKETGSRAIVTFPLSSLGNGINFVKNNNYTSGIMGTTLSGGYFHGYYKGTEYPFYFDGYKKSETYTKAQFDSLMNALKTRITNLENKPTGITSDGYIIKAGVIPANLSLSGENSYVFTTTRFSSPFPNQCLGVCITQSHADPDSAWNIAVTSFNKSQFVTFTGANEIKKPIYYVAFGK